MQHARKDYERIQDPAAEPELFKLLEDLAEAIETDDRAKLRRLAPRMDEVRLLARRATQVGDGSTPIGAAEPVFLIRGHDVCALPALAAYAEAARLVGAHDVGDAVEDHLEAMRTYQDQGKRRKRPDLPGRPRRPEELIRFAENPPEG